MRAAGVCIGDVEDQDKWKSRTRVADPNNWEEDKGEGGYTCTCFSCYWTNKWKKI